MIDRVGAAVALVLLWPLIAALCLAVLVADGRPVFVHLDRVGLGGRIFRQVKLRTMRPETGGATITSGADHRVTPLGAVLRRYRLDEVPQLVNVLRGEMALVGPRPETPDMVDGEGDWPVVLETRPGIAGATQSIFAQLEPRLLVGDDHQRIYRELVLPAKLRCDRWYVENADPRVDGLIVRATLAAVVGRPIPEELVSIMPDPLADIDSPVIDTASSGGAPAGEPSSMAVEVWTSIPGRAERRWQEWSLLAERAGNIFATPDFCSTWWNHFGRGEPFVVAARSDDGVLRALWPLYRRRRGPGFLVRSLGHGVGDELSLLCHDDDRLAAMEALKSVVGRTDLVVLDLVRYTTREDPERELSRSLGHAVEVFSEPCPVLAADGRDWEEFLVDQSRNLRQQIRRRERRLQRDHAVRYRLASVDTLDRDLDSLIRLHRLRFDDRESNTFSDERRRFHRSWAEVCLDQGWLRLWSLEVDGRDVASWYGFRFAGTESFYQSGRDPDWEDRSVGFVLLSHSVRAALDDGMTEYRFLRGGEEYKQRFATGGGRVGTIIATTNPLGGPALNPIVGLIRRRLS